MNTKLYALLLTLLCATGAVQASEGKEGKNPGDNNSTEQPRVVAFRFMTIGSNPLLSLLLAGGMGRGGLLGCGTCPCPACTARTSETTQSNQDGLARPARDSLEMLLAQATVLSLFDDISSLEAASNARTEQGSPRTSPQGSPRHHSLSPKDSRSNKDKNSH